MTSITKKANYETCPVCSGSIGSWRVKNQYNIDLCKACDFAFVNPRPSLDFLMDFYSDFGHGHGHNNENEKYSIKTILNNEENDPNSTLDANRMINIIKLLSNNAPNNKFLDVGCGYGFFSKEAINAGFDVTALELAERERGIASEITGINPTACSFEEFNCPSESLSVVFMSQILEHALDVDLWIKKAHEMLANDGIIAIALPNYGSIFRLIMQENEPFICPPAHLNFFNPKSLSHLLEKHGFKIETVQWVSRIPKKTFENRIPKFCKPILPIINASSLIPLKIIDSLHFGTMINIYGRKIAA